MANPLKTENKVKKKARSYQSFAGSKSKRKILRDAEDLSLFRRGENSHKVAFHINHICRSYDSVSVYISHRYFRNVLYRQSGNQQSVCRGDISVFIDISDEDILRLYSVIFRSGTVSVVLLLDTSVIVSVSPLQPANRYPQPLAV